MEDKIPCVLLVDDDETTNYINLLTVKKCGISDELLVALNGLEAINMIMKRCGELPAGEKPKLPGLILLDINMPIMNGFEFMEAFRALDTDIQDNIIVVVLSTSLNRRDLDRMKEYGVQGFISKPLRRETLQALVKEHFSKEASC